MNVALGFQEKGSLQIQCRQLVVLIPIEDMMSEENLILEADGKIHMEEPPPVIHHLVSELVLIPGACVRACVCQHAAHNCNSVR